MVNIVVAYDQNGAIGKNGDLPWEKSLPADLKHFKELTINSRVIMGRKTFETLDRPLPDRENIVITRQELALPASVLRFGSLATALAFGRTDAVKTFVIGGAEVYEQALPYVDRIYATEVLETFDGCDAFFPELNEDEWHERSREVHLADARNKYSFDFVEYARNKKAA